MQGMNKGLVTIMIVGGAFLVSLAPWSQVALAQPSWQLKWEQTLAAAKQEGKVTLIGPPPAKIREAIGNFRTAFPDIRLEYNGMSPRRFQSRITKERQLGQYLWDVIVSGISPRVFTSFIPAGWYEPLREQLMLPELVDDGKWLGGFDSGFLDKGKKYAYAFSLFVANNVYVNRDFVPRASLQKLS